MLIKKYFNILNKLHENKFSIIYRAIRLSDQRKVVLKVLKSSARNANTMASFANEELILSVLSSKYIVNLLDVIITASDYIHVFEDINGISLHDLLINKELSISEALELSLEIVQAIGFLHKKSIIHADINPKNIIYNQDTKIVQIIDFGSALFAKHLSLADQPESESSANLFYKAPEQSGRIDEKLNYLSDIYGLGMTLYHLFLGRVPFDAQDKYELIHKQIAFSPLALHEVKKEVPLVLSNIIGKLIEKIPKQRYQSVNAIVYDLEFCIENKEQLEFIDNFTVAKRDRPDIKIGEILFGRDKEMKILENVSDCISNSTAVRLMISGHSGVGKTRLIEELFLNFSGEKNYIIRAKFDQFNRLPYATFKQFFSQLSILLRSRSSDKVCDKITSKSAEILYFMFPELRDILPPKSKKKLDFSADIKEQLSFAVKSFFDNIATVDTPLIIYMDDLQWADQASVSLIRESILNSHNPNVHFLTSFRDNEIESNPSAQALVDRILKAPYEQYYKIELLALSQSEIINMLMILLEDRSQGIKDLGRVLYKKTDGNPFYLKSFVDYLISENVLLYKMGRWYYDIEKVKSYNATVNIAKIINNKFFKLRFEEQNYLRYLAVLAYSFNLDKCFEMMYSFGFNNNIMDRIVHAGFIEIVSNDYQFVHDQIQQNILASLDEKSEQKIHRAIGMYLESLYKAKIYCDIITITHHLQNAYTIQKLPKRLFKLSVLSLDSFILNNAYKIALEKLEWIEKYLFDESLWLKQRKTSFEFHVLKVKIFYLNTEHTKALKALKILMSHAHSVDDDIICFTLFKNICVTQGKDFRDLISYGKKILERLGVDVPLSETKSQEALSKLKLKIKANPLFDNPQKIMKLSKLKRGDKQKIITLLTDYWEVAFYLADLSLMQWTTLMTVDISFHYGNTSESTLNYVLYGSLLVSEKSYKKAYTFGEVALKLNAQQEDEVMLPKVHNFMANFISPYSKPLCDNINLYAKSLHQSKMNNDIVFGSWANFLMHFSYFLSGASLDTLHTNIKDESDFLLNSGDSKMIAILHVLEDSVNLLQGHDLLHEHTEDESLKVWKKEAFYPALAWYGVMKAQLSLLEGKYNEGLAYLKQSILNQSGDVILFPKMRMHFLRILLLLGKEQNLSQKEALTLTEDLKEFYSYIQQSPSLFKFEKLLLEAEQMKQVKSPWDVAKIYDKALYEARRVDNHFFLALASLCTGRFWKHLHYGDISRFYFNEALVGLTQWGAYALAKEIKKVLDQGKQKSLQSVKKSTAESIPFKQTHGNEALFKAFSAISKSQNNQELIVSLMKIILESAVASKAFLIFEAEGSFFIKSGVDFQKGDIEFYQERLQGSSLLPLDVISFVINSGEKLFLQKPAEHGAFQFDIYIKEHKPASCLAIPMTLEEKVHGVLYLENRDFITHTNENSYHTLELLLTQAAIIFRNTTLLENLKKSEADLNRAQEISHMGAWQYNNLDEKIIWSAETYRIYEMEPFSRDIDREWFSAHVHPDDALYVLDAVEKAFSGERYYDISHRIITANGNIKMVHQRAEAFMDGDIRRMTGTIQDITEIQKSADTVARLSQVVDQNPLSTIITDEESVIQYVNEAGFVMTGYAKEDLIGEKMHIFCSHIHDDSLYADLWHTITVDKQAWTGVTINRMKDGTLRDCHSTIFPIFNTNKEIVNFVTIQEDVTEKNRQEKIFLMQTRQAQMGEMLSMIAHQWRQPLSIITTLTNKERLKMVLNKSTQEAVIKTYDDIELQVQHLSRTISDFRDFFKPNKESIETQSSLIISKSLELIKHSFNNLEIEVEIKQLNDQKYVTYEHEVQQVVLNLFKNAQDAFIERKIAEPKIIVTIDSNNGYAIINIDDNALGIDESIIGSIFLPYVSTKTEQNGTGLGLYMSKTIIEEHCKGRLEVQNIDKGARFTMAIPLKGEYG